MKSSYKLYGLCWDHVFVSNKKLLVSTIEKGKKNVEVYVLSKVLSSSDYGINNAKTLSKGKLLVDYMPKNESITVWDFFLKRVLQISEILNVKELSCEDEEQMVRLTKALESFYKRKTPNRLLAQPNGVFQMIC